MLSACQQSGMHRKHLVFITKDSLGWKHEPQTAASSSSPSLHYLKMYSLSLDAYCPHCDAELGVRLQ